MAILLEASVDFAFPGGRNGHFARGVSRFCPLLMAKWPFCSRRLSNLTFREGEMPISLGACLAFALVRVPKWPFRTGRQRILTYLGG